MEGDAILTQTDRLITIAALALFLGPATTALPDEVNIGDSRDDVIAALDEPEGSVVFGDTEILHYPRGQVDIQDGKVVYSSVLSPAEFEKQLKRQQEQQEERNEQAAQRRASNKKKAAKIAKAEKKLEDMSGAEQVSHWQQVQRDNPKRDVSRQLRQARALAAKETKAQAAVQQQFDEGMRFPAQQTSSRRLRKFRRGRSASAIEARETQLRDELGIEAEE